MLEVEQGQGCRLWNSQLNKLFQTAENNFTPFGTFIGYVRVIYIASFTRLHNNLSNLQMASQNHYC